jgi:hypothetical protein
MYTYIISYLHKVDIYIDSDTLQLLTYEIYNFGNSILHVSNIGIVNFYTEVTERSPVDGGDEDVRGSSHPCLHYPQPALAYANQPHALVFGEGYHVVITAKRLLDGWWEI